MCEWMLEVECVCVETCVRSCEQVCVRVYVLFYVCVGFCGREYTCVYVSCAYKYVRVFPVLVDVYM